MAIFNMGGGGAGLNYTIEYNTEQPLKGNKNIIWIDSDAPVKTYSIENEKIDTYLVQTGSGTAVDNTNFAKFFTDPIINSSYNYEATNVVSYFVYDNAKDYKIDLHCIEEEPVFAIYKATSDPAAIPENISVEIIYPEKIEGSNTYKISANTYTKNHRILIGHKRPFKEVHCYMKNRFFYKENEEGPYLVETANAAVADRTYYYYTKKKDGIEYVDTYEKIDKFLTNTTTLVPTFTLSTRYNKSITYYKKATIPGTSTITYYKVDDVTQENYALNTYYFISNLTQDTSGVDDNLHYQYYNNEETSEGGIALGLPIVKSYTANTNEGESTVTVTARLRCKIASNVISYIKDTVQMSYFRCKSEHSYKITNVTKTDANRFFFYHDIVNAPMDGSTCSQIPFLQSEIQENTIIKNNLEEDCYIVFSYTAATGVPIFTDVTVQQEFNDFYKESLTAVDVNKNYYMGTSELQTPLGDSLFSDLWIKMGNSSKEESFNLLKKQNDKVQVYPIAVLRKFNLNPLKEEFNVNIEQSEVWGFMTASIYNANNDEWYTLAQNGDSFDDTRNLLERTIVNLENNDVQFIAPYALYNYATLSKVSFPNCLSVGESAFYNCSNLKEVYLPNCSFVYGSVSKGTNSAAFMGCSNITKVTLGYSSIIATDNNNTMFPFWGAKSSLQEITLPRCKTIGLNAFSSPNSTTLTYSNLKIVNAPNLETISSNAFYYCSSLSEVNTGEEPSIKVIQNSAFYSCKNLKSIKLDAVTEIGQQAFQNTTAAPNDKLISVNLQNATTIGSQAFQYCTALADIGDLNKASFIGPSAFQNCAISQINAPKCNIYGSTTITAAAHPAVGCNATLKSLYLGEVSNTFPQHAFYNYTQLSYVKLPKVLTITAGSTAANKYGCFSNCLLLTSAYLDDLTTLGAYAFISTGLQYINKVSNNSENKGLFCPNVIDIGTNAFQNCTKLEEFYGNFQASIKIGQDAFNGCTSLKIVSVPYVVINSIGTNTFKGCTKLKYLNLGNYCISTAANRNSTTFSFPSHLELESVYMPNISIINGNGTPSLAAFYGCTSLKTAHFNNCSIIGIAAFQRAGITTIDTNPEGPINSKTLYIPKIQTLSVQAFMDCTSLVSGVLPILTLPDDAFNNCGFEAINNSSYSNNLVVEKLTGIGAKAFASCGSLKTLICPDTLTTIGQSAFKQCQHLIDIKLNDNLTAIGAEAFFQCGVDNKYVSEGKNVAKEWAIKIPSKITKIEASTFGNCTGLCACVITNSTALVTLANVNAFSNCKLLSSMDWAGGEYSCGLYVPKNLEATYSANANWKTILNGKIYGYDNLASLSFIN